MEIKEEIGKIDLNQNNDAKLEGKEIVIFGSGVNGAWVYEQLMKKKSKIICFLDDKHFEKRNEVPVMNEKQLQEADLNLEEIIVIVSFYVKSEEKYNEIKERLQKIGFREENIVHFVEAFMESYFDKELLVSQEKEIELAYSRLEEEESRRVFENYIKAIVGGNAEEFSKPVNEEQYFDKDIIKDVREGTYFVDCGAYIGDTFESFQKQKLKLNYIGFEPDINNFNILSDRVKCCETEYHPVLFPCATSKENALVSFSYSEEKSDSPGSAICESGNVTVPGVALDTVISGLPISYIKMDIEGAEYDSLQGAEQIIRKYHPDLAICTYHKTDDIWRLINLVYSFNHNYQFYLRSYYLFSRETVLYAIEKK
ncbi:FkbM family methyltransferase [Roseburia sp. 499]|uniref:FkbM family methyltransferase n=1 Tax=Roseburia sp. 499 TaxID=1261634 RepID=UPI0009520C07|nr:FkbM family methyltransferase [Roseburia sp. 499]WVK70028.1 FkbM family methyltransferase [Roseburia sp. 499]